MIDIPHKNGHPKFTEEETNKYCSELFRAERNFCEDRATVLSIIEKNEIDLMKVNRYKPPFWMATINIDDGKMYKHCNYIHADLSMAVLGALLWKKGYRPS